MKFKSQVFTQTSGSVGGLTFGHNKGGLYTRARSIPVDPATVLQITVRSAMAFLVNRWNNVLTQASRDLWNVYAAAVAQLDTLGSPFFQSGQNAFVQSNMPRRQSADVVYTPLQGLPATGSNAAAVDLAPLIQDRGEGPAGLNLTSVAAATVNFTFDDTQPWAAEDDANMYVWVSRPRSASRLFFKGPYRLAALILGNTAVPVTSPQMFALVAPTYVPGAGQTVRLSAVVTRADGRSSAPVASNDVVAS